MASSPDLPTLLQKLKEADLKTVSFQHLAELTGTDLPTIMHEVEALGIPSSDHGVDLNHLTFHQSVGRDAHTQVGNLNRQYNVQGSLLQLPEGSAEALHGMFPQPGERARSLLRSEATKFVTYLKGLPPMDASSDQSAKTWYAAVEDHCQPLAQALFAALQVVPPDVVDSELAGLMEEAIRALDLRISLSVDSTLAWRTYPLIIIATAVILGVMVSKRWNALRSLIGPVISTGEKPIRWLYLTGYVDSLPSDFRFPGGHNFRFPSILIERRITQLLVGESGWLKNDLPVFGNEKRAMQAHALLAYFNWDAQLRYFTGHGSQAQQHLRMGDYLWDRPAADEAIVEMIRGVKALPEHAGILVQNIDVNYSQFNLLMDNHNGHRF